MTALNKFILFFSSTVIVVLALLLVKSLNISYPLDITITNTTRSSELAVVGEGKVEAVPDIVYIDLGITVTNAITAEDAQRRIDEVNNKLIQSLKSLGIFETDIKTSNYSIYPQQSYTPEKENRIVGYNGNATVNVKVRDIKLATRVINEATKAGANQVTGSRFVIDKPEKFREEARNKAIENAKEQAGKLASQLGLTLGKVTNIVEANAGGVYPQYERMDMALPKSGGGGGGPELSAGTQIISSTVTLYFEKK